MLKALLEFEYKYIICDLSFDLIIFQKIFIDNAR